MRWHAELSDDAQQQLARFPRKSGVGGRLRKRVGPYRIIFRKFPDRGVVEISAILVKSKGTYG